MRTAKRRSMLVIGECMMELCESPGNNFRYSFAGDTYNAAVYAKRAALNLNVAIYSAVGTDPISEAMLAQWQDEGINTSLVTRSSQCLPGLYAITTDEHGERSFLYWRRESAATRMMTLLAERGGAQSLKYHDLIYFSGISLAILSPDDRAALLVLIAELRQRGSTVAFDPNYRASMWVSPQEAAHWFTRAYQGCDIALPGLEDHQAVFGHRQALNVIDYFKQSRTTEVVIKCGPKGIWAGDPSQPLHHHPFTPAPLQVDSTAAGDSFAGTYLARRLGGAAVAEAIAAAAEVACQVVQHKGAILPKQAYQQQTGQQQPGHRTRISQ